MPGPFVFPVIADPDIEWACGVLNLRPDAFHGEAGNDPRVDVLKARTQIDVAACPGSGKTTLLVAKLAILARRWEHRDQGVCVLSHTNVARQEIETRLGGTAEARRLLSYPHHVGTIHGFINTYIAIPWLRSLGYPVRRIDDVAVRRRRWFKLSPAHRLTLSRFREPTALLCIRNADFGLGDIAWGRGQLQPDSPLYMAIREACLASAREGEFCYDEMFVFAHDALDRLPGLAESVRRRFPLLFVDEVQDNTEAQSVLLSRIFSEREGGAIRQRFGDMNQAIYGRPAEVEGAQTDTFPSPAVTVGIPNSHRFGQIIANAADPLGLAPAGLVGAGLAGRAHALGEMNPLLLLFGQQNIRGVLPAYARHLGQTFGDDELREGTFTALGAVHKDGGEERLPRSVGHYWPDYDHRLSLVDPKAETLLQHIRIGVGQMADTGEVSPLADETAAGILELASRLNPTWRPPRRRSPHREVLAQLATNVVAKGRYVRLIMVLADGQLAGNDQVWFNWALRIRDIALAVAGIDAAAAAPDDHFLAWEAPAAGNAGAATSRQRRNIYQFAEDPRVRVRVGSIHSAKGETHTATLVLETFYRDHHLRRLKPWLLGAERGSGRRANSSLASVGLKQHYVAMTRPTHLLALAMRAEDFSDAEIAVMQARNWRVAHVDQARLDWV